MLVYVRKEKYLNNKIISKKGRAMRIFVGTSGYSYKEWKGSFYPEKFSEKNMLHYYSGHFNTVEINNTFYKMPKKDVLASWRDQVNEDFRFVIKANKRLTAFKNIDDIRDSFKWFCDNIDIMGRSLGVVLFQFPPFIKVNPEKLESLLDIMPEKMKGAFEFKSSTWFKNEIYDLLKNKGAALVISETDEEKDPELIHTSDWGYLRLRRTDYNSENLKDWAEKIQQQNWEEVYVFFKHEDEALGPKFAMEFNKYILQTA